MEPTDHTHSQHLRTAVEALICMFGSPDGVLRRTARRSLVAVGEPAITQLAAALKDRRRQVRWEAAKTLGAIASPHSASALAEALGDDDFGVRWLAAEGLIAAGRDGIRTLMSALIADPESSLLRDSAHHVLRALVDTGLGDAVGPLLAGLDSGHAPEKIMIQAKTVRDALDRENLTGE